jgi:hypothetical protein
MPANRIIGGKKFYARLTPDGLLLNSCYLIVVENISLVYKNTHSINVKDDAATQYTATISVTFLARVYMIRIRDPLELSINDCARCCFYFAPSPIRNNNNQSLANEEKP